MKQLDNIWGIKMRKIITEPIRMVNEVIYSRYLKLAICDTYTKLKEYILSQ